MSELPDRPDLGQLRRQARELLHAATRGHQHARDRLRAVSHRITLSTAQLALAREYGFASWAALRTEVLRRRRLSNAAAEMAEVGAAEERWSLGGATAITTTAGVLYPGMVIVGPGHAVMDARLIPAQQAADQGDQALCEALVDLASPQTLGFDDVTITDDHGRRYVLRVAGISTGDDDQPVSLSLAVDPAPGRGCGWLELRGRDGSVTRLLPSPGPAVSVGMPAPLSDVPVARARWSHAQVAIERHVLGVGQEAEDVPTPELLESLPPEWSGMLDAAGRTDGPGRHMDLAVALPRIGDTTVHLDSLASEPDSWRLYLRATPEWWAYSEDLRTKWAVVSIDAVDERGGRYLEMFGGGTGHGDYEEVSVRFRPRLDPLARTLTLTFRGADLQVAVRIHLVPTEPSTF